MKTLKTILSKKSLILFLLAFLGFMTVAEDFPSGDEPYLHIHLDKKWEVIYGTSFKSQSSLLKNSNSDVYKKYKTLFNNSPYKKNSIIFASPQNQISNASVQVYPLPTSVIYSSPGYIIDKIPINNWLKDVLAHEMAHVFQVNSQTKFSHFLSYFLPPYNWFIYPNIYLTNFILEGNAVLHESIYGTGGRLFSGWARAFVFAQLKDGLDLKRVFNIYNDSFSSTEKYLHGGYFYSYLNRTHSLEELNKVFTTHSKKIILPIGINALNKTFKKTLGKDFYTLFKEYKSFYLSEAIHQQKSPSPVLLESQVEFGINSDEDSIFFLTSTQKNPPQLIVMDKKTKKLKKQKIDMPLGKVFKINGEYYSAGSGRTDATHYEFALFKDNYSYMPSSRSLYVLDRSKNKMAYLDAKQMLNKFKLYIGKKFYDDVNSTAILDSEGSVYYFKQNKELRTLYKNKKALVSFKSYYGFPVESDAKGVYFIASTAYGSSLFLYKDNQIFRLSPSDRIVAGRKINSKEFLVAEISSSSYQYKIISIQKMRQEPAFYRYSFKKQDIFKAIGEVTEKNKKNKKNKKKNKKKKFNSYNSFTNLKFEQLEFLLSVDELDSNFYKNPEWSIGLSYLDPMEKNKFSFSNLWTRKIKRNSIKYRNTVYRLNWGLEHEYEQGIFSLNENQTLILNLNDIGEKSLGKVMGDALSVKNKLKYKNNEFKISVLYPIVKKQNTKINLLSEGSLGSQQLSLEGDQWKNYIHNKNIISFLFQKKYPHTLGYYKKFKLNLFYELLNVIKEDSLHHGIGVQFDVQKEIMNGLFLSSQGEWSHTLKTNSTSQLFYYKKENDPLDLNYFDLKQKISDLKRINFYLKKELNQSLYSLLFPVSLRRWAPLLGASFIDLKKNSSPNTPNYILHAFLGGEFDIALNYKAPVLIGTSIGLVWKWEERFSKVNPRLHNGFYMKTKF